MRYYLLLLCLLLSVSLFAVAEEKKIEAGILYDESMASFTKAKKKLDDIITRLEQRGLKAEKVNISIFYPENRNMIFRYSRIYIHSSYVLFTPQVYQGMAEYAFNGGLLITSSPCFAVDTNENGTYDKDEFIKGKKKRKSYDWPQNGIFAHSSTVIKNIKILFDCPLTRGFEEGSVLEEKGTMPFTRNKSAEVVVSANTIYKGKEELYDLPMLTYKKSGKGAFIYIGYEGNEKLFLNCFSNETLDWLVYSAR